MLLFRYRLARLVDGGGKEVKYAFTTEQVLLDDFWKDVDKWGF